MPAAILLQQVLDRRHDAGNSCSNAIVQMAVNDYQPSIFRNFAANTFGASALKCLSMTLQVMNSSW